MKYWHLPKSVQKLYKLWWKQEDKRIVKMLKNGFKLTYTTPKYLDKTKYRGRGRPRKTDYTNAKPLFS